MSEWTQAFRDSYNDSTATKSLGLSLATFANADGTSVRPGTPRLMVAAGIKSETTVTKGLADLMAACWIVRVAEGTRTRAAEYRLILPPDVDWPVDHGRKQVALLRDEKRRRDEASAEAKRDRRRGLRP